MSGDFWAQIGVMALTFGLAVVPGLLSRRMGRSDYPTLVAFPTIAFPVAILPGILAWGFDEYSATCVLGALTVIVVTTLSRRFQPLAKES